MRRLLLLFVGLAILLWGRSLLAGDSAAPDVLLRDGLLVVLLGVLIFALNASAPSRLESGAEDFASTSPRRIVAWAGLVAGLVGGVWLAVLLAFTASDRGLFLPALLWLGGLAVGVAGLNWSRRGPIGAASVVWSVESARRYLQHRTAREEQPRPDPLPLGRRVVWICLLLLMAVGLLVRLWNFAALPDGCEAEACDSALAAMQFLGAGSLRGLFLTASPAHTALTALFLSLFGVSQSSTLLLGLLLGTAAIPLFFAAASRFVRPATALLGALVVVFSPLLITLSRHPAPALLLLLLILALLAVRPDAGGSAGRWAATGALAGLTLLAAPTPLTWLLLLWFVITAPGKRAHWLFYYLPLVSAALPALAAGWGTDLVGDASLSLFLPQAVNLAAQLLVDGGLPALLALLGAAYLLRHIGRWWVWGIGFLLVGLPLFATTHPTDLHLLAPLLALLGIGAAVAIDQFVAEFARVWSLVLRPQRILAGAAGLLLLLLLLAVGGVAGTKEMAAQTGDAASSGYAAIGSYLYSRFENSVDNGGSDATLVLVPQAILNNPATQLAARGILPRAAHIIALDAVAHLPFTGPPFIEQGLGDLLYILPTTERSLRRYLPELYPGMAAEPIQDKQGESWAVAYPVSRSAAANAQGLSALYFEGELESEAIGPLQEALDMRHEGPLDFQWDSAPPVNPPFTMRGQGALYVPAGGSYALRIVSAAPLRVRVELAMSGGMTCGIPPRSVVWRCETS